MLTLFIYVSRMLRIALCLCLAVQVASGQITGYKDVGNFSCDRTAELMSRTTETGTVMSPCYNLTDYPKELTSGLKLINISYDSPYVFGYRLTIRKFEIAVSDRLYVGKATALSGVSTIAVRDYTFTSSPTTENRIQVQTLEDGPIVRNMTLVTDNVIDLENFPRLIMDFYTVDDTKNGKGFLIDYAVDLNKCLFTGDDVHCKNKGICTRTGFNAASCNCDRTGYEGLTCTTDINECTAGTHNCSAQADCSNIDGGFRCTCKTGFTGNGYTCTDINECDVPTDPCGVTGTCRNEDGKFSCVCNTGYEGGTDGRCTNIDECARNTDDCDVDARATCSDTEGSFTCACKLGYNGDGKTCTNLNECTLGTNSCNSERGDCVDNDGSYTCVCKVGYTGDGRSCNDINECAPGGANDCHVDADCTNMDGSFRCACKSGFTGDGKNCADNDECVLNIDNCHADANCNNNAGSYTCVCKTGYTGDGRNCAEINECTGSPCHEDAECSNSPLGSFTCTCKNGFTGDGFSCTDNDECALDTDNCHANATCTNIKGSFTCACNTGYTGNGVTCADDDECTDGSNDCDVSTRAHCTNTNGSFVCTCKPGYAGDGKTCTDIDECTTGTHNCIASETRCNNIVGGFECICISPRFRGTPGNCDYYCGHNETCIKDRAGFIEMPVFYDGTKTYPAFDETHWTFQTSSTGKGIRFTLRSFSTEGRDDFLSMYPGNTVDTNSEILALSGSIGNLFNEEDSVSSSEYIHKTGTGSDVPAYINFTGSEVTLTLDRSDIYLFFASDRLNTSSGFVLAFEYDKNDCPAVSRCNNGGTCEDRAFAYQCVNCPGYEGTDCDLDIDECANNRCDTNANCTNTVGSFTCKCQTDFTGNGLSCNPLIVLDNYRVQSTLNTLSINFDITSSWRNTDYLVSFLITIRRVGGGFTQIFNVSLTDLIAGPLVVSGLATYTEYSVTVTVGTTGSKYKNESSVLINELGTQNFFTAESKPDTPKNLAFSSASRDRVTLTWVKPDEIGFGKVTHYEVCFAPFNNTRTQTIANLRSITKADTCIFLDDTYTTITLTNLPSYIDLDFKIRAYTSQGPGNFTSTVSAYTGTVCPTWTSTTNVVCNRLEGLLRSDGFPRESVDDDNELISQEWSFDLTPYPRWRPNFKYFHVAGSNEAALDFGYGDINIRDHDIEKEATTRSYTGNLGSPGADPVAGFTKDTSIEAQNTLWFAFISDRTRKRPGFQVEIEIDGNSCLSSPCLHGGRCADGQFSYTCDCTATNWRGAKCEIPHVQPTIACTPGRRNLNITFNDDRWSTDETVIGDYTVAISTGGASVSSMSKAFGESNASFTSLTPFTDYQVSVTATGSIRTPVVSEARVITCKTLEDVPTLPRSVVVSPGNKSLVVTWVAPSEPNGNVRYRMSWASTDHATFGETPQTGSTRDLAVTSYTISGLRDFRKYDVTVTAETSAGSIAADAVSGTTNPGAPPSFTATVTVVPNKSARVDWTFSPSAYVGPITMTFKPASMLHDAPFTSESVNGSPYTPTTYTYTGLEEDQMYNFTITASTGTAPNQTFLVTGVNTNASAPGLPASFTYDRETSTLTWTSPAPLDRNGAITGYRLVAVPTVPGLTEQTFGATNESFQLDGLPPFTTYNITLQAINAEGLGLAFLIVITTREEVPATPGSITQGTTTDTSMILSWPVQDPPVGEITYRVTYTDGTTEKSSDTASAETTLSGLTPYTNYTVTVVARTNAGDAPGVTSIFRTDEGLPTVVQNLVTTFTPYSIAVNWDAPSTPNGVISTYNVTWSPSGGTSDVSGTSHTIVGVTLSETTYTIEVSARTGAGQGPAVSNTLTTPKLLPTVSTALVVSQTSSTTATVTATAPSNSGSIIVTQYVITLSQVQSDCQAKKDVNCLSNDKRTTATLPYVVTNLIPYRNYSFSIAAQSEAGVGPSSVNSMFSTLPGVPNPPTYNSTTIPGGVRVTINAGLVFRGPASYIVTVTEPGGTAATTTVPETDQVEGIIAEVNGLTGSTSYTVSVEASNSQGSTPAASTITITTAPAPPSFSIARTSSGSLTITITADTTATSYTYSSVQALCTENCTEKTDTVTGTSVVIVGLDPYTLYNVSVYATSAQGRGKTASRQQRTISGQPRMVDPNFKLPESNGTDPNFQAAYNVMLQNLCINKGSTFDETQGPITAVWYFVRQQGSTQLVNDSLSTYYGSANSEDPSPVWVAFKVECTSSSRRKRSVTDAGVRLGADDTCSDSGSDICNGQLKPETTYRFEACGFNEANNSACAQPTNEYTTGAAPGLTGGEIAAIVICSILFVILVILLIVYFVKRRKQHTGKARVSRSAKDNPSFEAKPSAQQQKYQVDPAPEPQTEYSGTNA